MVKRGDLGGDGIKKGAGVFARPMLFLCIYAKRKSADQVEPPAPPRALHQHRNGTPFEARPVLCAKFGGFGGYSTGNVEYVSSNCQKIANYVIKVPF